MIRVFRRCVYFFEFMCFIYILHANYSQSANANLYGSLNIHWNKGFLAGDDMEEPVLNSFGGIPIQECLSQCRSRSHCKTVEYNRLAHYCVLRSDVLSMVETPGHLVFTGFEPEVLCNTETCVTGEACDLQQNKCVITECGPPEYGRHLKGNRFAVNSKVLYRCPHRREQRTCDENGQWNQVTTTGGLACADIRTEYPKAKSGLFRNRLNMTIYCQFKDDGAGWLVFQRRLDGTVDFYRNWTEYRNGFGEMCGEFWFGLENIYTILNESSEMYAFELRVDLEDWEGNTVYALYTSFGLDSEADFYRLRVGNYSGTAGDSFNGVLTQDHNGKQFTTYDVDNDVDHQGRNCAVVYHGAWWFVDCHGAHLNGKYYHGGQLSEPDEYKGINWLMWKGGDISLKHVTMKIREHNFP